jgi:hypothetical protein
MEWYSNGSIGVSKSVALKFYRTPIFQWYNSAGIISREGKELLFKNTLFGRGPGQNKRHPVCRVTYVIKYK